MNAKGPGFAVLYRWRLRSGMETSFIEAWSEVSQELRLRGSLGSRLHRGPEGVWYSYAQWPNAAARTQALALPLMNTEANTAMQAAVAESLPEIVLESVSDFLAPCGESVA
jgi:hypothetical protein